MLEKHYEGCKLKQLKQKFEGLSTDASSPPHTIYVPYLN